MISGLELFNEEMKTITQTYTTIFQHFLSDSLLRTKLKIDIYKQITKRCTTNNEKRCVGNDFREPFMTAPVRKRLNEICLGK